MPMWRCPHCGTPQAETARCWVCKRSSTACGTCRNFRHSVAGTLGYCGLDRTRQPLAGDEIRPCWEAGPVGANTTPIPLTALPADGADRPRPIEFVEVGSGSIPTAVTGGATSAASAPAEPAGPGSRATLPPSPILPASEPGWSLWGDTER